MSAYTIIITPDEEEDLREMKEYIANTLLSPDVALRYLQSIRKEILTLSHLAASIAPLMDDPWKSMGIRKIKAKNFFVYYRIDETNNRVYVLAVVDQKRNPMEVLEKKFPHDD